MRPNRSAILFIASLGFFVTAGALAWHAASDLAQIKREREIVESIVQGMQEQSRENVQICAVARISRLRA